MCFHACLYAYVVIGSHTYQKTLHAQSFLHISINYRLMALISYCNAYHDPDDKLIEICHIFQNSIDHAALH